MLAGSAGAQISYKANPGTWEKGGAKSPGNRYVWTTTPEVNGSGCTDLGAGSTTGTVTIGATFSEPVVIVIGENPSPSVLNTVSFKKLAWMKTVPVGDGPGPYGGYDPLTGDPIDQNGLPVDPETGEPLPGQPAKVLVPLTNPFPDRGFGYDIDIVGGDGSPMGSGHIDLGPGETRDVPVYNPAGTPFGVIAYPVVDGSRGDGVYYPSTGGTGGGGGSSGPVVIAPNNPGTTTPIPTTPKPATGENNVATQNAIDRLNANLVAGNEAQRQQNTHIANRIDNNTNVLGGKLDGIKNELQEGSGGDAATAAEIQAALHAELKNGVTPAEDPEGVGGEVEDAMEEGEGLVEKMQSVLSKMQTVKTKSLEIVTALGLDVTHGTTPLAFYVTLPRFGGLDVNLETSYAWLFDIIRKVTLWVISITHSFHALRFIRGAFAD